MSSRFKETFDGLAARMSPRTRQWATAGGLAAAAVAILWAVLAIGSGDSSRRASDSRSDVKPTNVDLMAPGAQVRDVEVWVGKAGRELEQYKSDREEQRRINRERQEAQEALMRRFAELEQRLKSPPSPTPAAPPVVRPFVPPLAPPVPPGQFPPESALPHPGLPPPPRPRGSMPDGVSRAEVAPPPHQPELIRVAVSRPTKQNEGQGTSGGVSGRTTSQTVDTFLPVSFTRGVLLGGLDAPTGGQAQSNPHPILIRLSDNSVLPNRFRGEYRECFVIAAGYGDISSERAYLRTESLSCVRSDGAALELKIQGSVYGEDGKVGMRGRLVTKQGQMLANALMAGVISGIGQGVATSNTTFSTSALGSVATTGGADALKAGLGTGVGKALDRLAQYYIKLAEQTFPIIEIDAGREIDVVVTKGVRIEGGEPATVSSASFARRPEPLERYTKVVNDEDEE